MRRHAFAALAIALAPALAVTPLPYADAHAASPVAQTPDAAAAAELLRKSLRQYANAPALRDTVILRAAGEEVSASIAFDEQGNIATAMPGMQVTVVDEHFHVVMDRIEDRYLAVPVDTDLPTTWAQVFGPQSNQPFYIAARKRSPDMNAVLVSLGLGLVRQPQIVGLRATKDEDGRMLHVVVVEGRNSEMLVHIDAKSFLVQSSRILVQPPEGSDQPLLSAQIQMNPVISDELDEPITFDPEGRTKVTSPRELQKMRADGSPR